MAWPALTPGNADLPARPPVKKHSRLKLDTPAEMRRALARLIRMSLSGTLPTADLGRYANAIATLHRIATDTDLDALKAEVAAIERRLPA